MYSIGVKQSYTLQSVPPDISSTHLTPYIIITVLLNTFPVLYFTSSWLFCNYQFVLFDPFSFFTHLPDPPPIRHPSKHSLYLWFCFCSACSFIVFQIQFLIDMYLLPFYCSYFWSSSYGRPCNISHNNGLVVMNSFSFFLSGKLFICPLILIESFAG